MSVLLGAIWLYNALDTIIANSRKQTVLHLFLNAAVKTVAYLRVSTRSQDLANQKLAILEFSQKRRFPIDQFIESRISSRKSPLERRIDEMLGTLQPGDRLLVSELSRLGRSLSQVIQIVETLVRRKIRFIAIKEAIEFDGKQDLRTKVMIALFGLFAEVERDLISERTKEGLAAAKAKGKLLGRPKGALGTSRLDGKEQDILAQQAPLEIDGEILRFAALQLGASVTAWGPLKRRASARTPGSAEYPDPSASVQRWPPLGRSLRSARA